MKIRIYTDTSVVGGCEDKEFAEHSVRLMECFVRGERVLVLSSLTVQELAAAADPRLQLREPTQGLPNDRDPDATRGTVR